MKSLKSTFALIAFLASAVAFASTPVLKDVPIDHIYSPKGFDSNDNTEVIVSGYLPNLCHKAPQTKVVVKGNVIDIRVQALHYEASNPFCPEMIVPFIESVDVGVLDKGNYKILVNSKSPYSRNSEIYVNESTSDSVDEFVYANVEYVEKGLNERIVVLHGYNPSDCFVLDKIDMVDNGKDVFSVLPKMKQVADFCPMKMVPFSYQMEVPEKLPAEKVLLHVRVMNGGSVNSVFLNKYAK